MGGPCLNCGRSQPEHARRVQEAEIVRARERNAAIEECAMRIERADNSLWMKPNDLITYVRALKQPT